MIILHFPPEIEARLEALAQAAGVTKAAYAAKVVLEHIEDIEDALIADERIRTETGPRISLEELMETFADDLKANP